MKTREQVMEMLNKDIAEKDTCIQHRRDHPNMPGDIKARYLANEEMYLYSIARLQWVLRD